MNDNINSNTTLQPPMEKPETSAEIEPLHHLTSHPEDSMILQACPSVNGICCDGVNAIAEILSLDGQDDSELTDTNPANRRDSQPIVMDPKACLTPTNEPGCQRRGRFLIWPARLADPSLELPSSGGAL